MLIWCFRQEIRPIWILIIGLFHPGSTAFFVHIKVHQRTCIAAEHHLKCRVSFFAHLHTHDVWIIFGHAPVIFAMTVVAHTFKAISAVILLCDSLMPFEPHEQRSMVEMTNNNVICFIIFRLSILINWYLLTSMYAHF